MIKKEQIINCITNPTNKNRIQLIRDYCLEKGKSKNDTEIFLGALYSKHISAQCDFIFKKVHTVPIDIFLAYSNYIIEKKIVELNIVRIYDIDNNLIVIY